MPKIIRSVAFAFLALGLLGAGMFATETRSLLFWPSALCIAISSILALFAGPWKMESAPSQVAMGSVLLAGVYFLVRAWFSPVWAYAREDLLLIASAINVYLLSATVFSDRKCRLAFLWILCLLLVGNVVMSTIQFEGNWKFHLLQGYERNFGGGKRVGGFYNNSNHLGTFLLIGIFLLSSAAIFTKIKILGRLFLMMLALLSVLTLAMTGSRGAILASFGGAFAWGAVVLFLIRKTHPLHFWKLLAIGGGILLVGLLCILSPSMDLIKDRMQAGGSENFLQGDPRPEIWKAAIEQWKISPVLGAGSRMFHDGCIEFRTSTHHHVREALFVHNEWIQVLVEYGVFGLLLMLGVVAVHLKGASSYFRWFAEERFMRVANLQGTHLPFALGATAAVVAVAVHTVVEFSLHIPSVLLMTALIFGALANPGKVAARELPKSIPGMRWMSRGMLALCGLVILGCAAKHMKADLNYERSVVLNSKRPSHQVDKMLLLSEVLEQDPTQFQAYKERAELRFLMAREMPSDVAASFLSQAQLDAQKAIDLNEKHFYSYLLLSRILDAQQKFDASYVAIDKAYHLAPLYEAPRLTFGRHFESQSRWRDAELAYLWAKEANGMGSFLWSHYYDTMLKYLGSYVDYRLERQTRKP